MTEHRFQKWPSLLFHQTRLGKLKPKKEIALAKSKSDTEEKQNAEVYSSNSSQWIKTILTGTFKKSPSRRFPEFEESSDTVSTISAPLPDTPLSFSSFIGDIYPEDDNSSISVNEVGLEESMPSFCYKTTSLKQRINKRHYMIRPFEPTYQIELQKNQWLQLDLATSKQIERLRRKGFSKVTIREDTSLKKHIHYNKPNEMDVLLELSLFDSNEKRDNKCVCNQLKTEGASYPSQFSVRRTYWWQTSDEVGKAYIPYHTDLNPYFYNTNSSEPSIHLRNTSNTKHHEIKPLKYANPPFHMDESTISF